MTAVGTTAASWQVDAARATARFAVHNFGVRTVIGTVPVVSGAVTTDGHGRVLGLRAVLDAAGVDTGGARRDRDLRAPGLLAVEQVPTWLFVSEAVEPAAAGWRVTGRLTVRRPCTVVLDVAPPEPLEDGSLRVRATTTLDRRDAGVRAPRVLIGRRVEVELDAVLRPDG